MSSPHEITLSLGSTDRRDNWWLYPAATGIGFALFVIYSTYAAVSNAHYEWGPYLSPFYSPLIKPDWLPGWFSPAFFILGAPLGFRATCYYYRKFYYRSYFLSPPACAVGKGRGPKAGYQGERGFPLILQNLHRYFLYLALLFVVILAYDAAIAFWFPVDAAGRTVAHAADAARHQFGMGLGSLILTANVILLAGYTFGCHSLRHLVGGKIDCFSCHSFGKEAHATWEKVSFLNKNHERFAWLSLFSVGFADLYVRLVSMGIWHDIRFF